MVGLIAVVIGIDTIALRAVPALLLANAGVKQFFDPAHDSAHPRGRDRRGAGGRQRVPVDRSFGSTAIGFAGGRPAGRHRRPDLGVHPRRASFLFSAGCIALWAATRCRRPDEDATCRGHRRQPEGRHATLFGTPIIRSLFVVGAVHVRLVRAVERPAAAVLAQGPRARTEFQYGLQEGLTSRRLRGRLVLHGPVLERLAAGAGLDRRRRWPRWACAGSSTASRRRSGSRSCSSCCPASATRRRRSRGRVLLQRNTPREMRGRVFSRVLRHARHHLPVRHGRRRPGRRHRHPAADRRRVARS